MARSIKKPEISLNLPAKPDPTKGGGAWPLAIDHVENWAWQENVFTPEELDAIIRIGNETELIKASTYGAVQSDKNRNSYVQFLFPNDLTNWIFARLTDSINAINSQFFKFDLTGMEQGLQFTKYSAPGQHYDWHVDRGFLTATRKLSLSLQLNDPSEYKGGELQLKFGRKDETVRKSKGMATFFPSYTLHRVKPVTQGTRYSLVAWISGPPFK